MQLLTKAVLNTPINEKQSAIKPVQILQIGDGNFMRGFFDWMVDIANEQGLMNAEIMVASPRSAGVVEKMNAQDHLFTVLVRGLENNKKVENTRVVRCVKNTVNPREEWNVLADFAKEESLRFVVSNTTEAGIIYEKEAFYKDACPVSFPAKITALLWARFEAFKGSKKSGLVFLPCELIEKNGEKLRDFVLKHAADWKKPVEFMRWIQTHCVFCNTLVDRIVPGFPAAEAPALFEKLGYEDHLLVAAEPFLLWAIEGDLSLEAELPLAKAGLNVVWTKNLAAYRTQKVRILNGAHTISALAAYLMGLNTVKEMMRDATMAKFLKRALQEEIVPFVPMPEEARQAFAKTVLERFANPYIAHELKAISLNSIAKWATRVLPSVKDFAAKNGDAPKCLSFSLAALLWFYRGRFADNGDYRGMRDIEPFTICDLPDNLQILYKEWSSQDKTDQRVQKLLGNIGLWNEDLNKISGFTEGVTCSLKRIESFGVVMAMNEVLR